MRAVRRPPGKRFLRLLPQNVPCGVVCPVDERREIRVRLRIDAETLLKGTPAVDRQHPDQRVGHHDAEQDERLVCQLEHRVRAVVLPAVDVLHIDELGHRHQARRAETKQQHGQIRQSDGMSRPLHFPGRPAHVALLPKERQREPDIKDTGQPPDHQKLMKQRMAVRKADLRGNLPECQRKRKGSRPSRGEHHRGLGQRHAQKPEQRAPVRPPVDKKEDRSADHEIDRKIPEIRPAEHAGHQAGQQHLRPEERQPVRMTCILLFRPRVSHRHHRHNEEDVDVVGMQIPEHRGIGRKLVDRLVRKIRVIADIARRIRKPVAVLHAGRCRLNRLHNAVDKVMHRAAEGHGQPRQQTAAVAGGICRIPEYGRPRRQCLPGGRAAAPGGALRAARRAARLGVRQEGPGARAVRFLLRADSRLRRPASLPAAGLVRRPRRCEKSLRLFRHLLGRHAACRPAQTVGEGEHPAELLRRILIHAVVHQLERQRERKHEGTGCDQAPHHIVGQPRGRSRQLHEPGCDILSAVIIIDVIARVPGIRKRHRLAPRHRGEERVVHEFFRPVCLRLESDDPHPGRHDAEKQDLLRENQTPGPRIAEPPEARRRALRPDRRHVLLFRFLLRHKFLPGKRFVLFIRLFRLRRRPAPSRGQIPQPVHREAEDQTADCRLLAERQNARDIQRPGQPRRQKEADHLRENPAMITEPLKNQIGKRQKSDADEQQNRPPVQGIQHEALLCIRHFRKTRRRRRGSRFRPSLRLHFYYSSITRRAAIHNFLMAAFIVI